MMTPLEQFNEEVMKEFKEEFGEMIEAVRVETGVHYLIPDWITQKLTEHKELILKMVREKMLRDTRLDTLAIDNIEDDLDELGRILK
jgi:hypothetical protein